ncbi:hypothetical protein SUGI_0300520 [Cryptomeria japonica]|uniref:protein LEAD-SENSITIVE 1 n=1 Tax=Cryptomeria japonica TaxID=3369 RepID=UPI002408DB6B|nr:protein LEAD-SENSITIVE 1 [Cryptomeria japonica]GLJ17309.1 hypothetical protein SUGI_0300520 [Cryptomeria japonica]
MENTPCAPRPRIHVEMSRSEILAGDHIYTSRGSYDHHGIYIGENRVIHFQNSVEGTILASSSPPVGPCPNCRYRSETSGVVVSCLDCFLLGGKIYRYEYGRGITSTLTKQPWCASAASDVPENVICRSKELLKYGFGEYDVVRNNCEHFALLCKTGEGRISGQVVTLSSVASVVVGGLVAVPILLYRYNKKRWARKLAKAT